MGNRKLQTIEKRRSETMLSTKENPLILFNSKTPLSDLKY
ncbi:hypothetical protein NT04LM_2088 [Listeria monocytogenes FSL F2-208]|nr:hypothetical protein NT04LM_2088 [Listeria monocytogenes FSL F2-208]